jgi:hypothetical protein
LLNEELSSISPNHLVEFLGLPSYGDSEETGPQKKISGNRKINNDLFFILLEKCIRKEEWKFHQQCVMET